MGATLNTASMMEAYTLADRGTWLKMRGRLDDSASWSRAGASGAL